MPGGKTGNSAANPSSMPCTSCLASASDFVLRADEPIGQQQSESMHEGPARQNRAGNLPFVSWGIRNGASQTARDDHARKQSLGLLGFGQFDGGAATIRTAQIASEHQAVERRVFNAMVNVSAQHREQLLASIAEARDFTGHALRQHLEPRRRDGRQ